MAVNGLKTPDIKPGQRLVLPGTERGERTVGQSHPTVAKVPVKRISVSPDRFATKPASSPPGPIQIAPVTPSSAAPEHASDAVAAHSDWLGSYEVKAGDSLYAVARRHNVKLADLQRHNNITDPRKVRPGVVLKVPAAGGPVVAPPAPPSVASAPARPVSRRLDATPDQTARDTSSGQADGTIMRPTIINRGEGPATETRSGASSEFRPLDGSRRVAALNPAATQTDAGSASSTQETGVQKSAGKLRWPVKGKVVSTFGPRPDGSHNDGINLSVPVGTEVHAAEAGEVVYAGNELKSYGNLVLIRHPNGWVTAYGHNEALLVARGDKVKRGQPISKVGKSGSVEQPQLHFEIRENSKPIDPIPHLEKL